MAGLYNETFFRNFPDVAKADGILYCVVLVNKKTSEREVLKIGIAKGKTWKDAIRRSSGFKGYDIRIQKIYTSTLEEVWKLEQALHEQWKHKKKVPKIMFGGYTECFEVCQEIISSFPNQKQK